MKRWIAMFIVGFMVVGCARVYKRQAEFVPEEYAPYAGAGTSRLCGQVFLSLDNGQTHPGGHDYVLLVPVTSYTQEAFKVKVVQRRRIEPQDPQAQRFEKTAQTDQDGRFCFLDVPAGDYYVLADVTHPDSTKGKRVGTLVYAQATVNEHDNVHIMVTQ